MTTTNQVNVTINRGGVTVTATIDAPVDWQPTRQPRPCTWTGPTPTGEPTRTTANPQHDQWKAMDRRTSYRTGCDWHRCPNCEGTGLRRFYQGTEECDECGWKGPAIDLEAIRLKRAEEMKRRSIRKSQIDQARNRIKRMTGK